MLCMNSYHNNDNNNDSIHTYKITIKKSNKLQEEERETLEHDHLLFYGWFGLFTAFMRRNSLLHMYLNVSYLA